MSETHVFYAEPAALKELSGGTIVLRGQECTHLVSVLRLQAGAHVRVLDGEGRVFDCTVVRTSKHEAELMVTATEIRHKPESLPIVALAFSKAVRRGFFLEKAVELGAHEVWLWQGDHSQGKLPDEVRENWQGKMAAGCKQCGNPWMPVVRAFPQGLAGVIEAAKDFERHILPWEKQMGVPLVTADDLGQPGRTIYIIGPEGGFSEKELASLTGAGYKAVSFGRRILRCETAATLCLGLHWWASQQEGRPDAPRD